MLSKIKLFTPPNSVISPEDRTGIISPPFYREITTVPVPTLPDNNIQIDQDVLLGTDLVLVYSGGSFNGDPNLSLGGDPSSIAIPYNSLNNLFDDVDEEEAEIGITDYRCVYFFNNSETATFWNPKFSIINNGLDRGAEVFLGFEQSTERQRIAIYGNVSGGDFTLKHEDVTFKVDYSFNEDQWANNIQNGLRNFENLQDVVVTHFKNTLSPSGPDAQNIINISFEISFEGSANLKRYKLLELDDNSLTGNNRIVVSKLVNGGPIDSIAQTIGSEFSPPINVEFNNLEYSFPDIGPGSGIPIWVKRVTKESTGPYYRDYFDLKILGNPFKY